MIIDDYAWLHYAQARQQELIAEARAEGVRRMLVGDGRDLLRAAADACRALLRVAPARRSWRLRRGAA